MDENSDSPSTAEAKDALAVLRKGVVDGVSLKRLKKLKVHFVGF